MNTSNSKKNVLTAIVLTFFSTVSINANSTLITNDWQMAGDNLMVLDTTTNLEWLSFSQTTEQSVDHVSSQFGIGGAYEGLRFATNDEVIVMWESNFNIDLTGRWGDVPAINPTTGLNISLADSAFSDGLGETDAYSPYGNFGAFGFTNEVRSISDTESEYYVLGARTSWSDTHYYTSSNLYGSEDRMMYNYVVDNAMGSYLVRSVPEPSNLAFVALGLICLGLRRRKHTPNVMLD